MIDGRYVGVDDGGYVGVQSFCHVRSLLLLWAVSGGLLASRAEFR